MKKLLFLFLFITPLFHSCDDGYSPATLEQTIGCFKSGDDVVKITDEKLQFNDGLIMDIKRSSDGYSYYINGFFKSRELLATQIEYNSKTKEFRWTRFESGINVQIFKKVDCPQN